MEFLIAQDNEHEIKMARHIEETKRRFEKKMAENTSKDKKELEADLTLYREFVKNIDSLSPAEKAVFRLYMEGHTAKEISEILFLSMNTIKTHNRHIYKT